MMTTSSYVVFKIITKSSLPQYTQDKNNQQYVVYRRFSDFDYLLKALQETPEYNIINFPPLPEKRMYGN